MKAKFTLCNFLTQIIPFPQNIDLNALTGWIPERVAIRPGSEDFHADKEFIRIMDRFHKGHCLITMATGEMSEAEGERAGLVPTHAYAMLDIRTVKV